MAGRAHDRDHEGERGPGEDVVTRGDAVVFNDTRVIPARLTGTREREGQVVRVEATLHQRKSPSRWTAFMRPGKRLHLGDRVRFGEASDRACLLGALDATIAEKGEGGEVTLSFDLAGPDGWIFTVNSSHASGEPI